MTSWIDELNRKSAHLTTKLEKCRGLADRLDLTKQWRTKMKDILAETSDKLENFASLAMNVPTDVLNALDKVSAQSKGLSGFMEETLEKME